MKESIKKRIEAVRRGEVPEGYRLENGYLISDDWKTTPLNSRFTRSTRKNSTGCENVLTISAQMGLVNQREFYDKDIASEDKSGYFLMKNGEFAYNKSYSTGYPYGAIKQLTKYDEGIVSPLYICFAPKAGTNTAFYTQYFEGGQYNREIYRVAQEGARNHGLLNVAVDDFFTGTLVEPSAGEQQKISEILEACDRMIELKQSKIDELKKLKQVCLLEIFPQKGQTIPKRRFPGFSAPWEQRKFEEIAVRSSVICSDDTLPRVEYEDIVSGAGRLNKDIYAKQSSKSGIAFHQGDVLYGKLRPYLQNWLLPTFDGLAVGDFWVLQPQNADSSFLYRLIQSRQFDEVANQSTGTKMPRADWKLVSKTVFSIPSNISEQAAIGTYFTALDSLITLHQRELAEVGKYKKALMQLLLTGLVRVNA